VKGSILIVEDEPGIELALRGLLRREGYDVSAARSGREAFEQIGARDFDLILTDLSLGDGVSGLDVLQHAKQAHPETAVIMITAYGSEDVAERAVRAGADAYVPKPFDNDEIRRAVRRALAPS
jgi:DNA-binding NtrC family response regulator